MPRSRSPPAFTKSCNGPFAQLADQIGADRLRAQAAAFGFGTPLAVPMSVTPSDVGELGDGAALAQSGIGQRDVRITPLQNALITATVANGGVPMAPHLVSQVQGQDLSVVDTTEPDRMARGDVVAVRLQPDRADGRVGERRHQPRQDSRRPAGLEDGHRGMGCDAEGQSAARLVRSPSAPAQDPEVAVVAVIVERDGNRVTT